MSSGHENDMAREKFFPDIKVPRIPPEIRGIQINFCKNPTCSNFGVIPLEKVSLGAATRSSSPVQDTYKRGSAGAPGMPYLGCQLCGESFPIKSNRAVVEEIDRLSAPLRIRTHSCPDAECSNHSVPVETPKHYQSFGKTAAGSARYRCKACGRLFSVAQKATLRQRKSSVNRLVFSLLMNKSPLRRICEVADINAVTLYQRIDFFHRQCIAFAANRERRLLDGSLPIRRLYLAVDRQEYTVNWSSQADRRNVRLHALASADLDTRYVFGMHLDFDPALDPSVIEPDAAAVNDHRTTYAYRKYARVWLAADYDDALRQYWTKREARRRAVRNGLVDSIESTYEETASRNDVEQAETMDFDTQLPSGRGMQIHNEYTLYGHFFFLERLLRGVEKVRFFMDQESGIRAACLAAFSERVKSRTADAFYVRIAKGFTVNERRRALGASRAEFEAARTRYPDLTESEVEVRLIQERLARMQAIGKWSDRWVLHPFPSMSEPEKAMCYLTDFQDYDADHLARLYAKASLHAVDSFFMQVRRRIALLERPIESASTGRRSWHGYSPYNPAMVEKMLAIFRVFHNYVLVGEDKKTTPAMRLGLAKAPIDIEDLLYFVP
jgi:transposase-like protein